MFRIINKKQFTLFCLTLVLIVGAPAYASEPEFIVPQDRSADYISGAYGSVLPAEAKEMISSPGSEEKISAQTSTDSFLSKIELPKEETPKDQKVPSDPRDNLQKDAPNQLAVRTVFDSLDDQVRQNISFQNGSETASFRVNLQNSADYRQAVYQGDKGDTKVYQSSNDLITYTQSSSNGDEKKIELKEIIYATNPNQANGHSQYVWNFSGVNDNARITLEKQPDGSVSVFQEMQISGVDPNDKNKQQHVMDVVKQALNNAQIQGRTQIALIHPVVYVTSGGAKKTTDYQVNKNTLTIDIQEDSDAYPLLIDPTFEWMQWMGGYSAGANDIVRAVAVNGDEIYVGGHTSGAYNNLTTNVAHVGGENSGGSYEGFIIELQDNEGAIPTFNWLQWLGGTGVDYVYALAVNGDEIYAGGSSSAVISETPDATGGDYTSGYEGFVVELGDRDSLAPTFNWLQYLGGTGNDYVDSLAVNNDEIYAGGYVAAALSETPGATGGDYTSGYEGFVVELGDRDSLAPTFNWLQYLGGTGSDYVYALAVNNDEIYAGGYDSAIISETPDDPADTGGDFTTGSNEGFVVELGDRDNLAPTFNWLQWLGGSGDDRVQALAVNNDEIYADGYASDTLSETPGATGGDKSPQPEGFVVELGDQEGQAPTFNWLQWLGGNGQDFVYAVAVNNDEIYAGGYAGAAISETPGATGGDYTSGNEGFVVELGDRDSLAPTFNWLQWLGGTGSDYIYTLTVNNDEIYVGGYPSAAISETPVVTGGSFSGGTSDVIVVELGDRDSLAPTFNWLQWLGGIAASADYVKAIAVNGDEIYAGGYANATVAFSTSTAQVAGDLSGSNEGFVVELQDNAGAVPTLNWLQWLGGTGNDYIYALAVNNDEIYAGGTAGAVLSETPGATSGDKSADFEGFVVELLDVDDSAPTFNWLQWLGGTSIDYVYSLAVNADEIYAGGFASAALSETPGATGGDFTVNLASSEGFVVELGDRDNLAPTFNWLQYLGGTGTDQVYALAVNADEIYVGGYANATISETPDDPADTGGDYTASAEGFVVELGDRDSLAPTFNWLQWLGGTGGDYVYALAVNGDEIYADGYAGAALSETPGATGGDYTTGYEGFVVELGDQEGQAPTFNWLQWLGGDGTDYLYALAVNNDEIYAGGYVNAALSETPDATGGDYTAGNEAFVVELGDRDSLAPTFNWLQWLGGTSGDQVNALAVNSDEIYAGGYSNAPNGWEAASYTGLTYYGGTDVTIIEIMDLTVIQGGVKLEGGLKLEGGVKME